MTEGALYLQIKHGNEVAPQLLTEDQGADASNVIKAVLYVLPFHQL